MNESAKKILPSVDHKLGLHAIFLASLAIVLLSGPFLWIARIGWIVLALIFMKRIEYGIYAIFFFSTFFNSSGFMLEGILTIKHFHLSVFILLIIRYLNGMFIKDFKVCLKLSALIAPIYGIVAIGILNFYFLDREFKGIKVLGNLSLVLMLMTCFSPILIDRISKTGKSVLTKAIAFLVLGVALQVMIAFFNLLYDKSYLGLKLIHNNHLGLLCSLTVFYGLIIYAKEKEENFRRAYLILTGIVIVGLIASCSRTAWISSFVSLACLSLLLSFKFKHFFGHSGFKLKKRTFFIFCIVTIVSLSFSSKTVLNRFKQFKEIIQPESWAYTFGKIQSKDQVLRVGNQQYRVLPYEGGYYFNFINDAREGLEREMIKDSSRENRWIVLDRASQEELVAIDHKGSLSVMENLKTQMKVSHAGRRVFEVRTEKSKDITQYLFQCFQIDFTESGGIECDDTLLIRDLENNATRQVQGDVIIVGNDGLIKAKRENRSFEETPLQPFRMNEMNAVTHFEYTRYAVTKPIHAITLNQLSYEVVENGNEFLLKAHNFGFLGNFRLAQLKALGEIMKTHLFLGVGFLRYVIDFHGFYFLILGGSGIFGLFLLLFFGWGLFKRLWQLMTKSQSAEFQLIALSAFSTILAWYVINLTETYFLQFSVWINIVVVAAICHDYTEKEKSSGLNEA